MSYASKVRAAHRKQDAERDQKMAMYAAAMNALSWWEQTNGRADSAINAGVQAAERVSMRKTTVAEWLKLSPIGFVATLAGKLSKAPVRLAQDVTEAYEASEVWQVAVMLGGKEHLSPQDIAKTLDLPVDRIQAILKQLGDEAKVEMKRKIADEVARRDRQAHVKADGTLAMAEQE
jgi:hypothetical protein